jgi:hypothetical protein
MQITAKAKFEQHAKHPKASLVFGVCTLCWSLLASLFMFAGGVAVFNLSIYDAMFSGALKPSITHPSAAMQDFKHSPQPVGSIMKARSESYLYRYVSKAGIYQAFYVNKSRAMCYGGDASYLKSVTDPDTKCSNPYRLFQPTW